MGVAVVEVVAGADAGWVVRVRDGCGGGDASLSASARRRAV
ncbi:hypothetical protein SBD_2655 [Streptomyces bottropensis ATCC 25435]|uniref:Uncharacterized protein n=1 Tax=Streptomyces bottropensis ATCC 25435 TaxID=1054862 RepID=M3F1G5_9ACTN|nr:hypothetical protein SBD_2655 [Streptomyces bottropensis ATCC 25435]